MKKLILLFSSVVIFQLANAQSFYKHALVISAGFGGDAYSLAEKYYFPNTNYYFTVNTGVGNASYPVAIEYGLNDWLGLGLTTKFDNYILKKDSNTNNYQPTAYGLEYGLVVNFHIVRGEHLGFFAGLDIGGSGFTYTMDQYNDQLYGKGAWFDVHATLQYYFGRFGIFGSLSFPTMNYTTLTSNNANITALGQYILSAWEAKGASLDIGIQYRFGIAPSK